MLIGRDCFKEMADKDAIFTSHNRSLFEFELIDAELYNIRKLDWYYGRLIFTTTIGKFGVTFIDYGISGLYERQKYAIAYNRPILSTLYCGTEFSREMYNFPGTANNGSNDFLSMAAAYAFCNIETYAAIKEIPIKRDIKLNAPNPEFSGAIRWRAAKSISLYGIYFKDDMNHSRYDFGQKLALSEPLAISAGFLTAPQVYYLGTNISYKRFAFEYVFYDVSQLPSCWSLALIIR
ncbi:MAG: hypothetical protein GX409_02575 [candidate division Zixibacteria bacterium]|nr:hypothetical protein [candidate division Zixibacteria bacterium]